MPTDTTSSSAFDPVSAAEQRIIEEGKAEWKRKRTGADWEGWLKIGRTLDIGRSQIMRELHTNQPLGRAYNEAFSRWLRQNELDTMDKVLRAALLECMLNSAAISAWRETLAVNQRMEWNHPRVVLRHWRASLKLTPQTTKTALGASKEIALQTLAQQVEQLKHENAKLRARDSGGSSFTRNDSAEDIVRAIANELAGVSEGKWRLIVRGLGKELETDLKRRKGKK
jgi:hypothetical protein